MLGGRTLDEYAQAGGVRSLYLIADDYVLPYSFNTTAGIGWQINAVTSLDVDYVHNVGNHQLGTTDLNLPASGAITAANPRPVPQFSQVGMLVNFSESWYDAFEVQLRTRVRGTDSLQVSYAYSKSTLDGVTFYSTYPRHRPDAAREGHEPDRHAAQPQRGGVDVAAVGRAVERRLPGDQRRAAGGDRRASTSTATSTPERPARGLADHGRAAATSTASSRTSTRFAPRRNQGADRPGTAGARPDHRRRRAADQGVLDRRRPGSIEAFLEAYNATNYTTLTGGTSNMSLPTFLVRTGARDARQVQWGARYSF